MTLLHQAAQKAVEALQHIADMDPKGQRADDLGRAARVAREGLAALQQQPEPVEQPTLAGVETVSDADNQWFGDMMILQVLADSDCINHQEREVLTRWMTASDRPSALQQQEVPREPVAADAKSILEQVANAPNEENCAMCNGRGFYGIPGQRCSFCKGTGRVQWRSAPDAASPSTTRQQEVGSEPQDCPVCKNGYLAIRTNIYKDGREFVYCDCCGCMADRRVWNRIAAAPSTPEKAGGVSAPAALRLPEPRQLPKMDASYSSNSTYFRGLGWNECLGEVKRLNADGVKEVPVAQP